MTLLDRMASLLNTIRIDALRRGKTMSCASAVALSLALSGCGSGVPPHGFPVSLNKESVFLGDSITYLWQLPIHNAGIPGQHASEIAARFATDVVPQRPAMVIILAGTNDIRATATDDVGVVASLESMVKMGQAAGITVVLSELPPTACCDDQVQSLNAAIARLAEEDHLTLVDYHTPMAGHPEYFRDALHPNTPGYQVMEGALTAALAGRQ